MPSCTYLGKKMLQRIARTHCTFTLHLHTAPEHCTRPLRVHTARAHCTLHVHIARAHCMSTLQMHIAHARCTCTLRVHIARAPCPCTLHVHNAHARCTCDTVRAQSNFVFSSHSPAIHGTPGAFLKFVHSYNSVLTLLLLLRPSPTPTGHVLFLDDSRHSRLCYSSPAATPPPR